MSADRLDISDSFTWEEGLPRPQWELINTWVAVNLAPEQEPAAWTDIARQWLEKLGGALGREFATTESEHFLLLAPRPEPRAEVLLELARRSRQALTSVLSAVAEFKAPGKQVVIVLPNPDAYYAYLSAYYPEGHHGHSAGMHIREGYPHVALCGTDMWALENTLAHELTHASLAHLSLPQWVEEGLAQMFEHEMTGRGLLLVNEETAREHKRFWAKRGLDLFWRGEGFGRADKAQRLSYQLAEILMRLLVEDHRPRWFGLVKEPQRRFFAFLRAAESSDCGGSASREHLGFGLGELAARFLGPGRWEPGW